MKPIFPHDFFHFPNYKQAIKSIRFCNISSPVNEHFIKGKYYFCAGKDCPACETHIPIVRYYANIVDPNNEFKVFKLTQGLFTSLSKINREYVFPKDYSEWVFSPIDYDPVRMSFLSEIYSNWVYRRSLSVSSIYADWVEDNNDPALAEAIRKYLNFEDLLQLREKFKKQCNISVVDLFNGLNLRIDWRDRFILKEGFSKPGLTWLNQNKFEEIPYELLSKNTFDYSDLLTPTEEDIEQLRKAI